MGNKNNTACCDQQPHQQRHLRNKRNKRNKDNIVQKVEEENNNINNISDQDIIQTTLDERRIVFVSLIGLYSCWKSVPSVPLYTSLLLIPLKKIWIYEPQKYLHELKQSFLDIVAKFGEKTDLNATNISEFFKFIKWKDSQGLVMWIVDYFQVSNHQIKFPKHSSMIARFWYGFNDKLACLYDEISGTNYASLCFEEEWWKNKDKFVSKYGTKYAQIFSEYQFITMNYNAICEIIYQSNPKSLRPVIVYRNRSNTKCLFPINRIKSRATQNGSVMSPLSPIKEKCTNNLLKQNPYLIL